MKDVLYQYYGMTMIGSIKITSRVFKIKTSKDQYIVKITKKKDIEKNYEMIEAFHLKCFIQIIKNKYHHILTPYQNEYLYLMPCVENNHGLLQEMKIKFYFETLAYLHSQSFYYTKINQDYFEKLYQDILSIIRERELFYEKMIEKCETVYYRSPSEWMFIMNYYRIHESLQYAKDYLKQYIEKTKNYSQIRVCLNYKHFDYDHISLKEKIFISLDSICIDLPIYDLFDMYQKIPDILFDLDCFSQYYFQKVDLLEDEKLLLCCLMSITPIIYFEKDEIENIIKLSRLLYYLDSVNHFIEQI